jgi:hypothetical protein
MKDKQLWHTRRIGIVWLVLLLGFYGFGIQVGRLYAPPVYPPCQATCNCAMVNFWSTNPYTTCVGDFTGTPPVNQLTAILNCNSTGPCFGGGSTKGGPATQLYVGNTALACSPQTFPGFPQQYVAGVGGVTITGTVGPVNLWTCN